MWRCLLVQKRTRFCTSKKGTFRSCGGACWIQQRCGHVCARYVLYVARCVLYVARCVLYVARYVLYVARYVLYVARCVLYVYRYALYVCMHM